MCLLYEHVMLPTHTFVVVVASFIRFLCNAHMRPDNTLKLLLASSATKQIYHFPTSEPQHRYDSSGRRQTMQTFLKLLNLRIQPRLKSYPLACNNAIELDPMNQVHKRCWLSLGTSAHYLCDAVSWC